MYKIINVPKIIYINSFRVDILLIFYHTAHRIRFEKQSNIYNSLMKNGTFSNNLARLAGISPVCLIYIILPECKGPELIAQ